MTFKAYELLKRSLLFINLEKFRAVSEQMDFN